jgi:MFS transporter, MHS family, alpha-ketoglutarate permease
MRVSTTTVGINVESQTRTTQQRLRSIFGGSVGNLVEWYDWYTYSALSIYFAEVFFPAADQTSQLLNAAAGFGVGFIMRPIGAFVLGRFADRRGRKPALTLSVTLMCLGSLVIAVSPGYETIGVAAPVVLVLARLLQGFSVGGEYGTSATYMSEMATPTTRGFYSGVLYVTLVLGQLLALLVLLILQYFILTAEQLHNWGWRIPFFIGAIAALVALYLRRNLDETDAFARARHTAHTRAGQLRVLARHPRQFMTVIGLTMGGTLYFYVFTTYMQQYLVNTVGLPKSDATLVSAASLFIFMLMQPAMGALSDRVGRRAMLILFGALGVCTTVPLLAALEAADSLWQAFALVTAGLVISSLYSSISAIVKAELFPVEIRALGVGLPYSIAVAIFGGFAPLIGLWFKSHGHEVWFYWFITGCVFCSLLVYIFMRDTQKTSRIH